MSAFSDFSRATIRVMGSKEGLEAEIVRCDRRFRTVIAVAPPKLPMKLSTLAVHPIYGPILILRTTGAKGNVFREVLTGATLIVDRVAVSKATKSTLQPPLFDTE